MNWFMSDDVTSNSRGVESPDLEFKIDNDICLKILKFIYSSSLMCYILKD